MSQLEARCLPLQLVVAYLRLEPNKEGLNDESSLILRKLFTRSYVTALVSQPVRTAVHSTSLGCALEAAAAHFGDFERDGDNWSSRCERTHL